MDEIKSGLIWGRHQTGTDNKEWSRWVIVQIWGKAPFLRGSILYDPLGSSGGPEAHLSFENHIEKWQFGPELNIPDKNYISVRSG